MIRFFAKDAQNDRNCRLERRKADLRQAIQLRMVFCRSGSAYEPDEASLLSLYCLVLSHQILRKRGSANLLRLYCRLGNRKPTYGRKLGSIEDGFNIHHRRTVDSLHVAQAQALALHCQHCYHVNANRIWAMGRSAAEDTLGRKVVIAMRRQL